MRKIRKIFLYHILDSIDLIEDYLKRVTEVEFLKSPLFQDAVARRFEIIGEASKLLTKKFRDSHPELPWRKMTGMRDIIIHEYFGLDLKVLWDTAKKDLPEVKKIISKLIKDA